MAVFKCKMCGGTLEINHNETVISCEFCGTVQTLPKLDNDKKTNLYDRANHFRRNNEFDKAMGIYEQILNEDNTDSEAYWSLVLCRFGIEYVEDPVSHKRIPTINRAQFTSVFDDDNYKSALLYADSAQKSVYEAEAKEINEIQKGILTISQNEKPFDVFICYKETDEQGRRTPDSVLANDLYHQLVQEGFRVFFSRITLEDKLGTAYEPYIFAALNSAKVMVVIGTKPAYFQAVWVKNEWSRYLSLIKQGQNKILIPAYKDMDPYDLPEEFSHLQAQDMEKLGFMQDLIRGIKKITEPEMQGVAVVKETVVTDTNVSIEPLLKRVFMFLEDGDFASADEYCEKVLDRDPENAKAYLGKLMAQLKVKRQEELKDCKNPFDQNNNYQKILRFGDKALQEKMISCIAYINARNEEDRLAGIYSQAEKAMHAAQTEEDYKAAAGIFAGISSYKDAAQKEENCLQKADETRKDKSYTMGKSRMDFGTIFKYEEAIRIFSSIPGWRDADALAEECKSKIEEIKAKEEADRIEREREAERKKKEAEARVRKNKKIAFVLASVVCLIIVGVVFYCTAILPDIKYNEAVEQMEAGQYKEAIDGFEKLNGHKDSTEKLEVLYDKYKEERLRTAEVGGIVYLGSYEQDNNTDNGKEKIEWIVLEKKDNRILVISKYAIDCQPYNMKNRSIVWETCTLRAWLNGDFFASAFSNVEKTMVAETKVTADKNPGCNTYPGSETEDKIFLLSVLEADKYFISSENRKCEPTLYAKAQGAHVAGKKSWWWLRSPGRYQNTVACVLDGGGIREKGVFVYSDSVAVRPAMWIKLPS